MRLHSRSGYLRIFVLKWLKKNQIWDTVTNLRKQSTIPDLGLKVYENLKGSEISMLGRIWKAFTIRFNLREWVFIWYIELILSIFILFQMISVRAKKGTLSPFMLSAS